MTARSFMRGTLWVLVALAFVGHLVGGWHFSNRIIDDAFTPDPGAIVVPSGDFEIDEVTYQSELGTFDAWYLPAAGDVWLIHVHGLNGTPAEASPLFAAVQAAGYPQLSITYRNDDNQPADPSGYHRYGATEWEDILAAVNHAVSNGAEKVVLAGYSTGASHVLSFAYRHAFDEIGGIITDSANVDMGSTIDYRGSLEELPVVPFNVPATVTWVAKFFTSLRIDVNWKSIDYIERAKRSLRVPVLAIHGDSDESVPIQQSLDLAAAQPDLVDVLVFEGTGHVASFETDFDRYLSAVIDLLQRAG